ncbi:MAG: hypothetical protein PHQ60_11700 [Sideroxydans sp.]|nr:hypothetical protein [Sideroxydans sp.]
MRKFWLIATMLLLHNSLAQAEGLQVGVGVFALAQDGADFQINYRAPQSHYQFGFQYIRWTDVFHDPFSGNAHSSTTNTLAGPQLVYLFHPAADSSFYAGASLLKWTRTETPLLVAAASDTQSRADLYFGGGFTGLLGKNIYYNLGMFIAPNANLTTQTAISSEESSGNFSIQIQAGMAF